MEPPTDSFYRDWDKDDRDSSWFSFGRNPSQRVLREVRPLAVDYAERLWLWVFPTKKEVKADVVIQVAKIQKGWLTKVFETEPIWYGGVAPSLSTFLRGYFKWNAGERVFFLARFGTGYETQWTSFLQYCEFFPGGYEDGLLFHPTLPQVAVFWDGPVYFGKRNDRYLALCDK